MAPVGFRICPSVAAAAALLVSACSPEAIRVRDGGAGADPGNKRLVQTQAVDPRAADTTLWPGRAPTPGERLTAGKMPPPPTPGLGERRRE